MNPAIRSYFLFASLILSMHAMAQSPLKMRDTTISGPQTFALIVGVSNYKFVRPLSYADKDAELFRDFLKSPGGGNIKDENIFCLLNDQAMNSNFWGKGFQWLKAKKLQQGDRLFIYLAGHGDAIDDDEVFFLGYDCNPRGDKNNYLVSGAIQLFNLKKKIAKETKKGVEVFFIMDACRSSELPGGEAGQNFLNTAISEKQAGEIIMLATGAGQESLEDASIGNGHGLFTYYLIEGLNGMADSLGKPDQKISFRELQSYVTRNVPPIAEQRFNRKQDPFFCCNENSEKIISSVDTNYLRIWLKIKKAQQRGPGNSFTGSIVKSNPFATVDTLLLETYNRFYSAVRNNNLSGRASAEEYFSQLNTKFPNNPYTLDAKSTLAVEFVNVAQKMVDDYLGCIDIDSRQKQQMTNAGNGLEKAISILREDDEDFANSLLGRMYLLKASGNNHTLSQSFQYAHAALSIDPEGAYILNKLALLHLENKQADSAVYYATRATVIAPKWICSFTTLALAQKAFATNNPADSTRKSKKKGDKIKFGIMVGGGISIPGISFSKADWRQGNVNYNDSLNNITTNNGVKFEFGIISHISLGKTIAIRPALQFVFESGEIIYERKGPTGGTEVFYQPRKTQRIGINIPVPIIIRFSYKNIAPFLSAGPGISFSLKQDEQIQMPMKSFDLSGEGGLGVDIGFKRSGLILSPELRYSHGLNNIKGEQKNLYTNTISSLKKNAFTFSFYLRKL